MKLPAGLTAAGRMRWSFEALLDEEFPQRGVFVWVPRERSEYNFFCTRACVPHARYRAFIYLFDHPRGTDTGFGGRLHVSRKTLRGEIFGNFPIPIRIKGHAVACDKRETRFLVTYADSVSFGLNCLRRPQR